ncbi:MAG: FAD-binding oxidoreductase [Sphingobium sp.]
MDFDYVIVGGGIAGVSLAAMLPADARVVILEMEEQLGYHATGRSAANYSEFLASPQTLQLTLLGRALMLDPPVEMDGEPVLLPQPTLIVARPEERRALRDLWLAQRDRLPLRWMETEEARAAAIFVRPELVDCGIWDPTSFEVEVSTLHQGLIRMLRSRPGYTILRSAELLRAQRRADRWEIQTPQGMLTADHIVNAAGAWADVVAERCGVRPLGVSPLRRTVVIVPVDEDRDLRDLPLVVGLDHSFYFKRDGGRLLFSAADENEDAPGDAQPEELDVAIAMDRLMTATICQAQRPSARWAGLRSFTPDREMAIGEDAETTGFFWLVGQGGTGIQTSVGAARAAASLLEPVACALQPSEIFEAQWFAPERFADR